MNLGKKGKQKHDNQVGMCCIMRRFFIALFLTASIYSASWIIASFFTWQYFLKVGKKTTDVAETLIEIPYGSSLRRVSDILYGAGLIDDARQFYWYLRLGRIDGLKIQAGYYAFDGVISNQDLVMRLMTGRDQSFRFTFKEGQTLVDLANGLFALSLVSKEDFLLAMTSASVKELVNVSEKNDRKYLENDTGGLEGYLFPDTYFFSKRDTADTIIKKMHGRLQSRLTEEMLMRMQSLSLSLHEVLTLASIIEKETGAPGERPVIASVYLNRLKRGMRLQADPTVIYGIKNYSGKISKKDLVTPHPYNTYKIKGLPPGPIASPGLAAIKAVLWPAVTNYLFFVSKNDGSHVFCDSLSCHNKAVKLWQIDYFKKLSRKK